MLLLFVAQSLKPVKLLATLKRTQQRNKETGKQTTYVAEQQQKTQLNNTMTMADPLYVINESPQMDVFYWQNNIRTKCTSEPKSKLVFFFFFRLAKQQLCKRITIFVDSFALVAPRRKTA